MLNFAANLSFLFPERPFLDRFAAAAAAGFAAVEFAFAYEYPESDVAAAAAAAGVRVVLMNLPPGDWAAGERGLAALRGREADFSASLGKGLRYAEATGCRQIHVMAGAGPTCGEETFAANLRQAATVAATKGVRVLIEPINTLDMPGYFLTQPQHAADLIRKIAHPNLFLQLDLYHCQIMRGDLVRQIDLYWPLIRHIQIAGNPGRFEPDVGEINYPFIFKHLESLGYDGWIGCEYKPAASTEAGLAWIRPYLPAK